MGRRVSVTNLGLGPRGWPEIGKSGQTMLQRGENATLEVSENIYQLLQREAEGAKPKVELDLLDDIEEPAAPEPTRQTIEADLKVAGGAELAAALDQVRTALQTAEGVIAERDATIEAQKTEIEALKADQDDGEPVEYEVGAFVEKALADAGVENFSDFQLVLDAVEKAFVPFAKFDPDGDNKPGGTAGAGGETDQTQNPGGAGPAAGAETGKDRFDAMDDDALRAFITESTKKEPHPNAKRDTLLKKAREADAAAGEAV